jgi:hypothetical protein
MLKGTTVLGAKVHSWSGSEGESGGTIRYDGWRSSRSRNSDRVSPQLATLTLAILGWDGIGDVPYNVGSSSKLTVTGE